MYITTELLLLLLNSSGCQRPSYDCVTEFSISGEALKLTATGSRQILLISSTNGMICAVDVDQRINTAIACHHGECLN